MPSNLANVDWASIANGMQNAYQNNPNLPVAGYNAGGNRPWDWSQGKREQGLQQITGINTQVPNRFSNYSPEFGFDDMQSTLDDVYNRYIKEAEQSTAGAINRSNRGTAARMASQGITGGSVLNNQIAQGQNNILSGFQDTLEGLGTSKMEQQLPMMNAANEWQFKGLEAAQDSDFRQLMAALQKAGLIGNYVQNWSNFDLQKDAQPGLLDDIFSGIGAIGQIGSIPLSGGTSVLGSILGKGG